MELRQLRYLIAVADAESITSAARRLHVVQSAVSHQIRNLEEELGAKIFDRSKSGVKLTAKGQILYRHALAVVKHVEAAAQEVKHGDQEIRGKVSVGIPHSTAAILAIHLLKAVRKQLPHVEIAIHEGLSGLLGEQLAAGRLDFSILFDTEVRRGFESTPLVAERLHFVSSDLKMRHEYTRAGKISFREVMRRPLILPPQPNGIRVLLEREALLVNLRPNVIADITGVETMLAAVKEGLADTVMMAANAPVKSRAGRLLVVPIDDPTIERHASLFEPAQFPLTTAAASVRDITLQLVKNLVLREIWLGARLLEA
jgi:LysR family nitrogen assimilation transcriptional regulator